MINILLLDTGISHKLCWSAASRACYQIFYNLSDCMLLYRHQLSEPYIWSKFGCNEPSKIKLEKLQGKNLMLLHLDIYKEQTYKFKDLIEHCELNNIDIWISLPDGDQPHDGRWDFLVIIKEILSDYRLRTYELRGMNYRSEAEINVLLREKLRPVFRDIRLKKLLD